MRTDDDTITELLTRGVSAVYPGEETVREKLASGERLRVYLGMDATAPHLHLGHATKLAALERFRRAGHEIILLFGDFTAMIGDPTDKTAARTTLSEQQVQENLATWREQVRGYLDIDNEANPVVIRRNSEWHTALTFQDVLDIAGHFTVGQMLERDMFQRRMQDDKPIYLPEFMYPLMQGYDSVAMDVDVEIGGTDQTFNMLAGRTLQRQMQGREKYVIALELLEDPDTGKKLMNKSEGDFVPLDAEPGDMFGKIMALPDLVIVPLLRDATFVSMETVTETEKELEGGANPRDAKMRLAREIVAICHGDTAAQNAETAFVDTFQKGGVPSDMPIVHAQSDDDLASIAVRGGVVDSKSDFRRLVEQGAIEDVHTGEKIVDVSVPDGEITLKVGKHRFLRICSTE